MPEILSPGPAQTRTFGVPLQREERPDRPFQIGLTAQVPTPESLDLFAAEETLGIELAVEQRFLHRASQRSPQEVGQRYREPQLVARNRRRGNVPLQQPTKVELALAAGDLLQWIETQGQVEKTAPKERHADFETVVHRRKIDLLQGALKLTANLCAAGEVGEVEIVCRRVPAIGAESGRLR